MIGDRVMDPSLLQAQRASDRGVLVMRLAITALAIGALHTLFCLLFFQAGYLQLSGRHLLQGIVVFWGGQALLLGLFMVYRRLQRPVRWVAFAWYLWILLALLCSAYAMSGFRLSLMLPFFAVMMLASFRHHLGGLTALASVAVGGYLLVVFALWLRQGYTLDLTLEILQWLLFAATAISFVVTGLGVSDLRRSLTQKNRDLGDALLQVRDMAIRDELTGLYNRRHIMDVLSQQQALAEAGSYRFALCFVDLDHFKRINDRYGHGVGDAVLRRFGQLARQCLREADYIGRLGGEEFVLVVTQADLAGAARLAERLQQQFRHSLFDDLTPGFGPTLSVGVAGYRPDEALSTTLARADACLYQAKAQGRDCIVTEQQLASAS